MKRAIVIGALLISFASYSQQKADVIQQAMRDELDRNMKDLKADGFDKPFFINYGIVDQTATEIVAVLGALVGSSEMHVRDAESTRVLVGDYEFNDESLEDNLFSRPTGVEINMPIDDDYMGIRRSLWVGTDNLYRTASQQFSKNREILKEQNKPLSEIPHRRFAKVAPSHVVIEASEMKFDKSATEEYIRKLSAVFSAYTDLEASGISFSYRRGYRYQANSEGAMNKIPFNLVIVNVFASFRTLNGEFITENKNYYLQTTELPPFEKMEEGVKAVAETVMAASKAQPLQEEYIGPVLFLDADVAGTFWNQFLSFESGLRNDNNIPPLKGFSFEPQSGIESKIGKSIFAEGITVKALPKLKVYNDKPLLGSYEVDREGVVPADEIVLIENGVLKSLMNDRTLTKPNQTANGLSTGPGVLSISFKTTTPRADMKEKLIAEAKKQGLDYALMTRNIGDGPRAGVMNVYKVYVDDGREELVRQATMDLLSRRDFRKILATSKEMIVHNFLATEREYTTIICPEAILLEEVEFRPSEFPTYKEEVYVPSPLKK
jgi:predicted Zn-dependent protease